MGALPAGWHSSIHPQHNRPFYFNAVTQQSQWDFPTAAAAVPLPALPALNVHAQGNSPSAIRRVGNELGGAADMAAMFGLPAASRR